MKLDGLYQKLKSYVVDNTSLLVESTPVFAAFETQIANMTSNVSLNTRLGAALLGFAGIGTALAKGRDYSRKLFGISEISSESNQFMHDTIYLAAFNLVASPILYRYIGGETDLEKIAWGTGLSILIGGLNGPAIGYAIDAGRDLAGLEENKRASYPKFIKRQNNLVKKSIATLAIAGSLGLTAGLYSINPNDNINQKSSTEILQSDFKESQSLEEIIK